jgi:hypothetical protein
MVDIETMGTASDAAIIAIGAVEFGVEGLRTAFYELISLESSMKAGLTIDAGTIIWWMQQSEDARSIFSQDQGKLKRVLCDFGKWIDGKRSGMDEPLEIWGNGSDFDNVVLHNAYKKCDMETPWKFRENRCYRTMKNIYDAFEMDETGCTKHCAIDDAKSQAEHLIEIFRYIKDVGEIARGH